MDEAWDIAEALEVPEIDQSEEYDWDDVDIFDISECHEECE